MLKPQIKRSGLKPLWKCPRCGHHFVTRRMWHSCSRYTLAHHFAGTPRELRELFNRYLAVVRAFGPVIVISQKSRIAFQVRVRFAGAVVRNRWLECGFWLKRRAHPLIHKVQVLLGRDFLHYFHLTKVGQLDASLVALLREAYDVGCQRHLATGDLRLPRANGRNSRNSVLNRDQ
jgi:hypothetical protein